jgi:hypothetical protein
MDPDELLKQIEISSPRQADWKSMPGDHGSRHCPE